ncbi:biopolymer transport protein ExbD/TolR [Calothrix sp. NIES-4071]|nr:biopolymer transport protein ExbD/TolR [Calothrix sp. NIES-4071]BAZ61254.1 biopolymer transport protein ExbD/TolR [Calothrix sp. NIES-4105]
MKINLNNSKDDVQVQIIPLIDVIFCILTFFLLAALQFSRQEAIRGINLDLAKANSGTAIPGAPLKSPSGSPIQQGQRIVLYLDALGQIFDTSTDVQTQIPKDQLRPYLENLVKQNPTKPLVLFAARSVSYNDVIGTLDVLRQVGGDRVSLAVTSAGADQSSPAPTGNVIPNQTIPNTVVPLNPQISPQLNPQGNFNPNLPTNQAPQITVPGGAIPGGGQNINPGTTPAQKPAPRTNNTTPQTSN